MRLISALFVLVLGLVAVSAPATGDVGQRRVEERGSLCYNTGCAGKSPAATGCAAASGTGPIGYRDAINGDGKVEIMYSPVCHSYWARFVPEHWQPPCLDVAIQIRVANQTSTGYDVITSKTAVGDSCSYFWTVMIAAANRWAGVRTAHVSCAAGHCDYTWQSWSGWIKF